MIGKRNGRLVILSKPEKLIFLVQCDCGNEKKIYVGNFYMTKSCGCLAKKLSEDQVREIRRAWGAGELNQPALGRKFGVSQPAIHNIVLRKTWKRLL